MAGKQAAAVFGDSNGVKHGLRHDGATKESNGRTSFGKAFRAGEQEWVIAYGGDPSPIDTQFHRLANQTAIA